MGVATKIQWCDSTCNPTMGCEGCELWNTKTGEQTCYAGVLHKRYGGLERGFSPTFDEVTLWPGRMEDASRWSDLRGVSRPEKPWLDGLPRLIFVSDMSDALSSSVSFAYLLDQIVKPVTSLKGRRHCWLWLTKRPDRMVKFSEFLAEQCLNWPLNLWAGTSVTTSSTASRLKYLSKVGNERTVRFVSVEPQRESIDFRSTLEGIDWVIQGGESGSMAHSFQISWASSIMEQCRKAGSAYFLKQLGSNVLQNELRIKFKDSHAGDWSEWPAEIRVREIPVLHAVDHNPHATTVGAA